MIYVWFRRVAEYFKDPKFNHLKGPDCHRKRYYLKLVPGIKKEPLGNEHPFAKTS